MPTAEKYDDNSIKVTPDESDAQIITKTELEQKINNLTSQITQHEAQVALKQTELTEARNYLKLLE